ncbi:MAG TPA: M28 family peptidase [Acidimicrobiales bacterium]|jgi:hypothetical protein
MGNLQGSPFDRRAFMAGVVASAVVVGCSSDDDDSAASDDVASDATTSTTAVLAALPDGLPPEDVPTQDTIFGWINKVFDQGIRRPGYDADIWAEGFLKDQFKELGLENVRLEPIELTRWEPKEWSLEVTGADGQTKELDCFPLPYSAPVSNLEVELAPFDPVTVAGKASFVEESILRVPPTLFAGSDPNRVVDAEHTFDNSQHILPFGSKLQAVMEGSVDAGAAAFIGALTNYPGDSYQYFVPYDGVSRPIPGVWIRGSDGAWIKEQLATGPVRIKLSIDSVAEPFQSHNVVGELPGADDEVVMIGSHHDGPWSSAVEDGSGISLVLAQATFWSAQPQEKRPHKLVFLLHGGHMCGGAGLLTYIDDHREELDQVVLQVHLEHVSLDFTDEGGGLTPTGHCVPRWFFVSRNPELEKTVYDSLVAEELNRSMILTPTAIGAQPPTDGAFYYNEGVPITHFLSAPFYLFDEMDQPDKIDKENLVPLSRAVIRIVESTTGVSASQMRAGVVT